MKHLLNCCPICGEEIYSDGFNQYAIRRKIKRNGELSKTSKKIDIGSIEASIFFCVNPKCEFATNADWQGEGLYRNIRIYLENEKYYWEDTNEDKLKKPSFQKRLR